MCFSYSPLGFLAAVKDLSVLICFVKNGILVGTTAAERVLPRMGGVEEMGGTYFQSSQRIVGSRSIRWFALNTQYWRVELHSLIITPGLSLLSFVTFDKLIPLRIIFFISKMQITFLYSVPCISFLLLP